jgi:hypothetical protein
MTPLAWPIVAGLLVACAAFALLLDQVKRPVLSLFRIG